MSASANRTNWWNRAARRLGVLAAALTLFGPVSPAAPVARATDTCTTPSVAMYHVDALAALRRWNYASPLTGTSSWTEQSIGTGWNGAYVFSGGNGTIFLIDSSGNLRWYQDNNFNGTDGASWNPFSGSTIGTGWNALTLVTSGGNGVIYGVDSAGNLRWYRYLGTNGSPTWAAGSGATIGTGFNAFHTIVAGGSGVLYTVDSVGDLIWYRHLDPLGGTATWANSGSGKLVGTGWNTFGPLGTMGDGVLFGRDSHGTIWWYRHTDLLGGSATWANGGTGTSQGTGWNPNQIIADVMGCVSS